MIILLDLREEGKHESLAAALTHDDLTFEQAFGLVSIKAHLAANDCDVLIIGAGFVDAAGLEICILLRKMFTGAELPVLALGNRSDEQARVDAFKSGADDYLVAPISLHETVARVKALLRRKRGDLDVQELIVGDIRLDRTRKRVRRRARVLHLGSHEFEILLHLMESPDKVFTRARLVQLAWPPGAKVREATINTSIARLRRSLSNGEERDPIRTVRGQGYYMRKIED